MISVLLCLLVYLDAALSADNKIICRTEKRNRYDIKPIVDNFKISDKLLFILIYLDNVLSAE